MMNNKTYILKIRKECRKAPCGLAFRWQIVLIIFLSFFAPAAVIKGQDYHFSQFHAAPLITNPAYTGRGGSDYRIANIYRNQWAKIGQPYETFSMSLDKRMLISGRTFGLGGAIIHDQSSSFNLSANELRLSFSYTIVMDKQQVTFGIQPAYVMRTYDRNGLTFGSQFDGSSGIFNPSLPSNESGLDNKVSYFDLNAGALWVVKLGKKIATSGISVSHLIMPEEKFATSVTGHRLPPKVTLNGEIIIPVNARTDITPLVLYHFTPGANELLAGARGGYDIRNSTLPVRRLTAMTITRVNPVKNFDSFIIGGGADFKSLSLGISYDLNISPLSTVTNFNGAFEVSLIYNGRNKPKKTGSQPCHILN